jgi:hypothetical protein
MSERNDEHTRLAEHSADENSTGLVPESQSEIMKVLICDCCLVYVFKHCSAQEHSDREVHTTDPTLTTTANIGHPEASQTLSAPALTLRVERNDDAEGADEAKGDRRWFNNSPALLRATDFTDADEEEQGGGVERRTIRV